MRKQKILFLPLLMILTLCLTLGVLADDPIYLCDNAGLLTETEADTLQLHLCDVSDNLQANIVVVTVDSLDGKTAQAYADDTYDYDTTSGWRYGEDGVLFLIAMDERQWAISTSGYAITVIHEGALDHIEDTVVSYLSDGDYYTAFTTFADLVEDYWFLEPDTVPTGYHADPYYHTSTHESGLSPIQFLPVALMIGFLVALLPMRVMRSQLHSVHMQTGAWAYQKTDGIRITHAQDLFLYRQISKKPIPREDPPRNSGGHSHGGGRTHHSSSGRSHGGRSGRF